MTNEQLDAIVRKHSKTKQDLMQEFYLTSDEFEQFREHLKTYKHDTFDILFDIGKENGLTKAETNNFVKEFIYAEDEREEL